MEVKACDNIRNRSFKDDVERIAWKKIKQKRILTKFNTIWSNVFKTFERKL